MCTCTSLYKTLFISFPHPDGGHDNMQSPLTDAIGRKDSLSLNVEFVKVNISRSRRGVMHGAESLTASQSSSKLSSLMADAANKAANIVRFSGGCFFYLGFSGWFCHFGRRVYSFWRETTFRANSLPWARLQLLISTES